MHPTQIPLPLDPFNGSEDVSAGVRPLPVHGHKRDDDSGHRTVVPGPLFISPSAQDCLRRWQSSPIESFEQWMRAAQGGRGFKEKSRVVYRSMWRKLVKHAGSHAACLDAEGIERFLRSVLLRNACVVSPTQQRRYLVLLAHVQENLVLAGALQENFASGLLGNKAMKNAALRRAVPVALTAEQESVVTQSMRTMADSRPFSWRSSRDAAVVAALLGAGLKVGELQSMRLSDVIARRESQEKGATHLLQVMTNGGKDRRAPLSKEFEGPVLGWTGWLREQGAPPQAPLFISSDDESGAGVSADLELDLCADTPWASIKTISSTQIWRIVSDLLLDGGCPLKLPHQGPTVLRNSFALRQLRNGVPIERVALWLGHKDPHSTKVFEALLETERTDQRW